jgi:hypothetical protein
LTTGLYIDPGVHALACAWFRDGLLCHLDMLPREAFMVQGKPSIETLVIERMRIYPGKAGKGEDPNDLIDVTQAAAFAEGAIVARGGPRAVWVYAADWKGQVKKPIHHMRLWSVLTVEEREILALAIGMTEVQIEKKIDEACKRLAITGKVTGYAWSAHNLLDAVGIGLWDLKRVGVAGHRFGLPAQLNF